MPAAPSDLSAAINAEMTPQKPFLEVLDRGSGGCFSQIEYALRCATKDAKLEVTRAFECEINPSLQRDFQRKLTDSGQLAQPLKVVTAYVLSKDAQGSYLEKVCRNGFRSRDQPKLHVGSIGKLVKSDITAQPVDVVPGGGSETDGAGGSKPNKEKNAAEFEARALLRCKVCVRKPFVTYDPSYFRCNQVPDEYDSMVLMTENEDTKLFQATYIVRDAAQIVPEYLVEFNIAPPKKTGLASPEDDQNVLEDEADVVMCGTCKDKKTPAQFCVEEDGWMFCKTCLDDLLDKIPMIKSSRTIVNLADMKPTFAHCKDHPERKAEWWCLECQKAMCVACKVSGSHSKGRAAGHTLVPIREKYEEVTQHIRVKSPECQEAKDNIQEQIECIDERRNEVEANEEALLAEVKRRAQDLENQIRALGAKKLDSLLSRKHLAERNLAQINWASNFADYITDHTVMPAETFLQSAKHHEKLIESLLENVVAVDEEQFLAKADMQLEGHMSVHITEPDKSMSPPKSRRKNGSAIKLGGSLFNTQEKENSSPRSGSTRNPFAAKDGMVAQKLGIPTNSASPFVGAT